MSNLLELWRTNPSPTNEWKEWQRSLDRFFSDRVGNLPTSPAKGTTFYPSCEVSETPAAYQFKIDLPGMNKEGIKVEVHQNLLRVSGERKFEKSDASHHFSEVSYGTFFRSFELPETVDAERVEAKFENGVLSLVLNKNTPAKAKQVTIK